MLSSKKVKKELKFYAANILVWLFVLLSVRPVAAVYEGVVADTGDFPWFANLSGCGGVLIDPEWVMTARHCLGNDVGADVTVRGNDATPRTATIVRVLRFDATRPDTLNDIALAQIAPPLTDIETVALPMHDDWVDATTSDALTTVGNGRTRSEYVPRTTTPALDDEAADLYTNWYGLTHTRDKSIHHYNDALSMREFQTYGAPYPTTLQVGLEKAWLVDLDDPGGSCFGDSGGGVVYPRANGDGTTTPVLIGIISAVDYCKSMAIRDLFELDGDGDDLHHTLPNSVTIPFPSWYELQVGADIFGYTQYTNVIHPRWFEPFILCNLPHLDSRVDSYKQRTVIDGQLISDGIDPDRFERIMTWTAVELIDPDGDEICATSPAGDGTFTMSLPSNYSGTEMRLKIQSRLHHNPDDFQLGTAVVVPKTLLQSSYLTDEFDISPSIPHHVQPISMTIIASEPYGFDGTVHTLTEPNEPLVTRGHGHRTWFIPFMTIADE